MSRELDQIFTPSAIVRDMIRAVKSYRPQLIADFAAGDGAILTLASKRWPKSTILANDVDAKIVRSIRSQHPSWHVSASDVFNARSANRAAYSLFEGKCSVILLNPPFSCRGAAIRVVTLSGTTIRCSRALSFAIWSLRMLSKRGELIAVLPLSTLRSVKDREAWQVLRSMFDVEVICRYHRDAFKGCYPRSVLIRISGKRRDPREVPVRRAEVIPIVKKAVSRILVKVVRGWIPLHSMRRRSGPWRQFLHTTDLKDGFIGARTRAVRSSYFISGPGVLIPRVGRPDSTKLSTIGIEGQYALSDCLIALLTRTERDAAILYSVLKTIWPYVEDGYAGTCAPYLTIDGLCGILRDIGGVTAVSSTPSEAMSCVLNNQLSEALFSELDHSALDGSR